MNNLLIIVEGPDNSGKSTLIKNIKNHFNHIAIQNLHYSNVNQSSIEDTISYTKKLHRDMFELMEFVTSVDNSGVICDRSHLGEMIYGPIYRGYDGEYVLDIEREYHNRDIWNKIVLITMYNSPENLIDRDDGLSFSTDINKKKNEIDNFVNAHNKSTITKKVLIDVGENTEEETFQQVLNLIKEIYD